MYAFFYKTVRWTHLHTSMHLRDPHFLGDQEPLGPSWVHKCVNLYNTVFIIEKEELRAFFCLSITARRILLDKSVANYVS